MPTNGLLLVENDSELRQLLTELLEERGLKIRTSSSAEEARQMLLDGLPAAVISDVRLPGQSGLELAAMIKRDPRTAQLPVILMTGALDGVPALVEADAVLTKPFELEMLLATLARVVASSPRVPVPP